MQVQCNDCFQLLMEYEENKNSIRPVIKTEVENLNLRDRLSCGNCLGRLGEESFICENRHSVCEMCIPGLVDLLINSTCEYCVKLTQDFVMRNQTVRVEESKSIENSPLVCAVCNQRKPDLFSECRNRYSYCNECLINSNMDPQRILDNCNCDCCINLFIQLEEYQKHNKNVVKLEPPEGGEIRVVEKRESERLGNRLDSLQCCLCGRQLDPSSFVCPNRHGYCGICLEKYLIEKVYYSDCRYCCEYAYQFTIVQRYDHMSHHEKINVVPNNEEFKCQICMRVKETLVFGCENNVNYCEMCLNSTLDPRILFDKCKCDFCKQLVRNICEVRGFSDISSSIHAEAPPENPKEEQKASKPILESYCAFCKVKVPPDSASCKNNYYYCGSCPFLMNVREICQCEHCSRIADWIDENRRAEQVEVHKIQAVENGNSVVFQAPCHVCKGESNVAFACDHNLCYQCIAKNCFPVFQKFIQCYRQGRPEGIPRNSVFVCPVSNCKKNIRVPTELLLTMNKGMIQQTDLEILSVFIPYFDGIRARFSVCKCNRIVGDAGGININCNCRKRN